MIEAALRGKRLDLRAEDSLTATVFGYLRYLPTSILRNWLTSAQPFNDAPRLRFSGSSILIEFWPTLRDTFRGVGTVEPDLLLVADGSAYVVEAKLQSEQGPDQLPREWKSAVDYCATTLRGRVKVAGLLYVTAHLTTPSRDFEATVSALAEISMRPVLYWLPWAALGGLLDAEISGSSEASAATNDLMRYLREVGVLRFLGWGADWLGYDTTRPWRYARQPYARYWSGTGPAMCSWRYSKSAPAYWTELGRNAEATNGGWGYRGRSVQ